MERERPRRVLISVEQHFRRASDQHVYVEGPLGYAFFKRYLTAFDEVMVLARVATSSDQVSTEARADGPCVSFHALPNYCGPWEYLRRLPQLSASVRDIVAQCDAYILRVPGLIGRLAWKQIQKLQKPYALEVVGDPWDALSPRSVRVAFRPVLRRLAVRELCTMCRAATAVHYVTQAFLQRRYPPAKEAYTAGFSDALMDFPFGSHADLENRFARLENESRNAQPVRIGFIGSLAQRYKGLDVLLHALSLCALRGLNAELVVAGDGRYFEAMKSIANQLKIIDRSHFLGQLAFGRAILDFLDSIDLFVMPSYAEGMPRALLEAMARGCPCVATEVGGIPELLDSEDIVPPGDAAALAEKIAEVTGDHSRLRHMAKRNLDKAKEFSPESLAVAHRDFCAFVRSHSSA